MPRSKLTSIIARIGQKQRNFSRLLALVLAPIVVTCSEKIPRPSIGENIARPISLVNDEQGDFFYVLNTDLKHRYDDGSILIVDRQGERRKAVSVPRLGRHLSLSGKDLIATFDRGVETEASSKVMLFQIGGATDQGEMPTLTLKKSWNVDNCNPINAIMQGGLIAVSCQTGKLMLGQLAEDRSTSTLDVIREYPAYVRRALYIDEPRGLLYAFVSDWGTAKLKDQIYTDNKSFNETSAIMVEGVANDVPDELEKTKQGRLKIATQTNPFQFVVIDLNKEKADLDQGHFQLRSFDKVASKEMRWLYFNLQHPNGDFDTSLDNDQKFYRTNFWAAHPDPSASDTFYLSQRTNETTGSAQYSNNIVKVRVTGTRDDILDATKETKSVFAFERIFGGKDTLQTDGSRYLADFALEQNGGKTSAVYVSSFRSLANFKNESFALFAAPTDQAKAKEASTVTSSSDIERSFFAFAFAPKTSSSPRTLVAASFYGDSLSFFTIDDNLTFSDEKQLH